MFKLTDIFEKNNSIPWRLIEGQTILVDQNEGEVFRLTPVGTAIWEGLDGKRTIQEIIAYIHEQFEVEDRKARRDVLSFLKQLRTQGFVEPKSFGDSEKGIN